MAVIRTSLGKTLRGREREVEKLYEEMDEWLAQQPGFILSCHFRALDSSGEIGRLSMWESHEATDHVSVHPHVLSLRSRIHTLLEAGHQERLFEVVGSPRNIPPPKEGKIQPPSQEKSHPRPGGG